jgi:hypothetical protein
MTIENTTVPSNDATLDEATPQTETVTTPVESDVTSENANKQPSLDDLQTQVKRLESALAKANKDAKDHRLKSTELSSKAQELDELKSRLEAEKLSEREKQELAQRNLEKQLADLQRKHDDHLLRSQDRLNETELRAQAAHLGFADLSDAIRLIDQSLLEHDDDGVPTNARDVLESLLKAKPYLKASSSRSAPTSGGATNPSRSTTTASKEISWEMIAQLTPAEYAARSKDIQAWMAKNSRR